MRIDDLPGHELVEEGLRDLSEGRESAAAFLARIGSRKLSRCGVDVPVSEADALEADHRLYALLSREHGKSAHGRYNALLRELVSFERALEARHRRLRSGETEAGVTARDLRDESSAPRRSS